MIQPLSEARAKECTKFRWFFGVWENLVFCFQDLLTFRISELFENVTQFQIDFDPILNGRRSFLLKREVS